MEFSFRKNRNIQHLAILAEGKSAQEIISFTRQPKYLMPKSPWIATQHCKFLGEEKATQVGDIYKPFFDS